jgi:predicted phosphodiesterase
MKALILTDTHKGHSTKTHDIHEKMWSDISKEEFDVLLHTGDWTSSKHTQLEDAFKQMRKYIPNKAVLGVMGNHDFWNNEYTSSPKWMTLKDQIESINKTCKKYGVHHLQEHEVVLNNVFFYGLDSWYTNPDPLTNDHYYIKSLMPSTEMHKFMYARAHKQFESILEKVVFNRTNVLLTHHNSYVTDWSYFDMAGNPSWMGLIADNFKHYIFGHTHQQVDVQYGDCRILNVGADYDKPKYKVVDLV